VKIWQNLLRKVVSKRAVLSMLLLLMMVMYEAGIAQSK
jgi:hypothetical protein